MVLFGLMRSLLADVEASVRYLERFFIDRLPRAL